MLWKRVDQATDDSLADNALSGPRASWPTIAGTTLTMLEDIRARGDGPTLVSRQSVPAWEPRLGSVVNLETVNGPLPLLVNGALPDVPGSETAGDDAPAHPDRRGAGRPLARRGHRARGRTPSRSSIRAGIPAPTGGPVVAAAVTTQGSGGLTRPATATDLTRSAPLSYSGDVVEDVETRSLDAASLDAIANLSAVADLHDAVVVDPSQPDHDRDIAALMSVRWRTDLSALEQRVSRELAALDSDLDSISIDSPSTITLSSSRGGFPLTLANETDKTVRVGLDLGGRQLLAEARRHRRRRDRRG